MTPRLCVCGCGLALPPQVGPGRPRDYFSANHVRAERNRVRRERRAQRQKLADKEKAQ